MDRNGKEHYSLIDQSLISFLENSRTQWSIKDHESQYLFINKSALRYYGIPLNFDYQGCRDEELPHPGAELASEFQKNDKIILNKEKPITEIETHIYGKMKKLQPHICEKHPFYDKNKKLIGVICQGRNIENPFIYYNLIENTHGSLTTNPPTDMFTKRELEIIFLSLQRLSSKEVAKIINISHRTVENNLQCIYNKVGINSVRELREYCTSIGITKYIPELFLNKGVDTINS
ncbi:PAS domain-containing protein [Sodalis endosymbiont of Spalangia cameroni]|uniref:LuxR C-terminal-related transcriptional regulator n=1 Tax=Sodalis praecaptivus TaxID=1239307 RepID=UPI0031F7C9EF